MKCTSLPKVLIVEDSSAVGLTTQNWLLQEGIKADRVENGMNALKCLRKDHYALVLLDLQLPDISGLEVLNTLKSEGINTKIIVITAIGSVKMVIDVMRAKADDYIIKPAPRDRLITAVEKALNSLSTDTRLKTPPTTLNSHDHSQTPDCNPQGGTSCFIGSCPPMREVERKIKAVCNSKASVFITGESGTGKEVCAQTIHRASKRHAFPCIALNCAAIPKDLLESEIFGHVKGAFSGATSNRDGAARTAHGGTLFLDEICELDLDLQAKLLRFLQTGTVQKVGSDKIEHTDIRIICASNKDPFKEVQEGRFREDLFYRLYILPIHLPPLRERGNDILELARSFLQTMAKEENKAFTTFTANAEKALLSHFWPGNVRELQNIIRNAIILNEGHQIKANMLAISSTLHHHANTMYRMMQKPAHSPPSATTLTISLGQPYDEIEREIIESTIALCNGSVPKAAQLLNLSPSTLYRKKESWR